MFIYIINSLSIIKVIIYEKQDFKAKTKFVFKKRYRRFLLNNKELFNNNKISCYNYFSTKLLFLTIDVNANLEFEYLDKSNAFNKLLRYRAFIQIDNKSNNMSLLSKFSNSIINSILSIKN